MKLIYTATLILILWINHKDTGGALSAEPEPTTADEVTGTATTGVIRLLDNSPLRGKIKTTPSGKKVMEFLGIPFAEPPVDDQRFERPVSVKPWQEVLDAFNYSAVCYQQINLQANITEHWWNPKTMKMSEDCLYLNVWVPGDALDQTANYPVVVWFHGGYFLRGSAIEPVHDGKILASEERVIVITVNYRLGVFGFLYTGTTAAPGNMGLLDQLESLKWISKNIYHFGGDRNRVTLFGVSAGAESAGLHLLSALSRSHFSRAIMESGTPLIPSTVHSAQALPQSKAVALGQRLGCRVRDDQNYTQVMDMVECLKRVKPDRLLKQAGLVGSRYDMIWTPVVDGYFLQDDPMTALRRGEVKRTEVLLGSNQHEGNLLLATYLPIIYRRDMLFNESYEFIRSMKIFKQVLKMAVPKIYAHNFIIHNEAYFEYNDWKQSNPKSWHASLERMLGDYYFTCPTTDFAKLFSDNGRRKVYQYLFAHHSVSQNVTPTWMGSVHTEEVQFVFGRPLDHRPRQGTLYSKKGYTESEIQLTKRIMRFWANFARTGDPNMNEDGTKTDIAWPEFGRERKYLIIGENDTSVDVSLRQRQCVFWGVHIPNLKRYTDSCGVD